MHDYSGNHTLPCFFKLRFDGFRKFLLRHSKLFRFDGPELAPEQTVRLAFPEWRTLLSEIDDTPFVLINISRRELMRQSKLEHQSNARVNRVDGTADEQTAAGTRDQDSVSDAQAGE
ncbi:MAG: hypothetical protein MHM6MM_007969 [Cercozoa sp. M6MM]